MPGSRTLTGRVCVVTGGTRGIGAELTRWFAEQGASIAICARGAADVAAAADRIRAKHGVDVLASPCDVADSGQVDRLIADILERFGRLDVLVANAAVLGPVGELASIDMTAWLRAIAIDIGGVAAIIKSALPAMVATGFGRVLTLSGGGVGGPRPLLRTSAYIASKAAVVAFTEVLAGELAGTGVTANAIAPGSVPTSFMRGVLEAGEERAGPELFQVASDCAPADLTSLRDLVLYLVSDKASWLTGRCLSARWDRPTSLESARDDVLSGSRYTLRRIDEDLYGELKGDPR